MREGTFRQDLFHRVHVFPIVLPPLRDRREDIPPLIEHFVRQVCAQNGWKVAPFSADAVTRYRTIRGREISASCAIWWSDYYCSPPTKWIVTLLILPCPQCRLLRRSPERTNRPACGRVAAFEKETILAELERNHRHITNTAKTLGLERSYLYKKCQQLGIDLPRVQPVDPT